MTRLSTLGAACAAFGLALAAPAWAQKNSGPLLPATPPTYSAPAYPPGYGAPSPAGRPAPQYAPQYAPQNAPQYAPQYAPQAAPRAGNPDAERLAQSLPLDPQTRELQDRLPPDPRGTGQRLGLREPQGPATDLRGRTPSPREIVDALAPR